MVRRTSTRSLALVVAGTALWLGAGDAAAQQVMYPVTVTAPQPTYVAPAPVLYEAPLGPPRMRANMPAITGGAALLGVGWVGGLLTGAVGGLNEGLCGIGAVFGGGSGGCGPSPSPWLMMPIVGPWLALTDPANRDTWAAFAVIDGLMQAGGLALLIGGALDRHPVGPRQASAPRWAFAPTTIQGARSHASGFALSVAF